MGSALAAAALLPGLAQPHPAVLIVLLGVVGLGCGPLFPLAISTAGAQATVPVGSVTATLTAWGYLAYLGGPPVVGAVAERIGLTAALVVIGGAATIILLVLSLAAVSWSRPVRSESRSLPATPGRNN